jgi:hypothetical protein
MRTAVIVLFGLILSACQNASTPYSPATGGGPPYTVTYRNTTVNTTGTVPTDSATYQPGATVTVMGNTGNLSWPPFTWIGWNTKDTNANGGGGGGTEYPPGSTLTIQSNIVLYGSWQ